jgi:hypothetical protein
MTTNLSPLTLADEAGDLAPFEVRFNTSLQPPARSPNV